MIILHCGTCFYTFDLFLCVINLHVSNQFKVLQFQITKSNDKKTVLGKIARHNEFNTKLKTEELVLKLKKHVKSHYELIKFTENLDNCFKFIILAQICVSIFMICVTLNGIIFTVSLYFFLHKL